MRILKQSTAATVSFGPFVDKTDGITPETGLSTQAGRYYYNGTAAAFTAASWSHDSDGMYLVGLSTTHTANLGRLRVYIEDAATYCPVWEDFMVVTANVYDSFYSTDTLQADVTQINGATTPVTNLEDDYDGTGYTKTNSTIGTCTTNTDMVGTDNAFLAANAPANFSDLAITVTNGYVTVGTNNDKTGYSVDANNDKTGYGLADDAITAAKFDESTAYPLTSADTGATEVARTGADADTLETLSDEIAALNNLSAAQVQAECEDAIDVKFTFTGADVHSTLDGETVTVGTNSDKTGYGLADDAITAAKFDETTAYPLTSADSGSTEVARTGADGDTLETLSDQIDTIDSAAIADAVWDEAIAGHVAGGSFGEEVQSHSLSTEISALNDLSAAEVQAEAEDAIDAKFTFTGADVHATLDGETVTVGTNNDKTGYTVSTNSDKTGYSISGTKTTLDALNDVSTSDVNTQCGNALAAIDLDHLAKTDYGATKPTDGSLFDQIMNKNGSQTFDSSTDALEAIRDEGDLSWGSGSTNPNVLLSAEIATVSDQTHFTLATGSDVDDTYNDQAIVIYDDSNSDYPSVRKVSDYTGSTKTVTLDEAPDFTMGTDDSIRIFVTAPGTTAPTTGQIADAVWDEAKSGHVAGGSFGEEVQAHSLSTEISALNDLSAAEVQAECEDAIDAKFTFTGADVHSTLDGETVTVGTNSDKTGYSISGSKTTLDALNDVSAATVQSECEDAIDAKFTFTGADVHSTLDGEGVNVTSMEGVALSGKTGDNFDLFFHNAGGDTTKTVDDVGGSGASAAEVADAVWDELATGHTDAGKAGAQLWTDIDAVLTDTDEIQGKLPTNYIMGSSVVTDKDDEIDAIKTVTDNLPNSGALTDIDTGVNAIEAKLPTNYIMGSSVQTDKDDEIDAIKAKTDNLPADPASETNVNANETKIDTIDTVVDAIKLVTDNLPNSGALTDIDTGVNAVEAKLPTNYIMGSSVQTDKDDEIDAIKAKTDNLPEGVKKNTALNNFTFEMVDETDGYTLETGISVTAQRSIDGAAWESMSNSASEIGTSGTYKINLSADDTNGDFITYRFTGSGCRTKFIHVKTEA